MRRALRATVVGVVAAGLVLVAAAPASAHSAVVSTNPSADEVVTALPDAFEVTANETLLYVGNDEVFGIWARDADGLFYGDGCVSVTDATMSATPAIGAAGDYTLVYAFVSADGHPLTGEVPFTWAPTGDVEAATGTAEATRCGALAEEPAASDAPTGDGSGIPGDVWWIVAAVVALAAAVGVTVAVARRRPNAG